MSRVLVTGPSGQVGGAVAELLQGPVDRLSLDDEALTRATAENAEHGACAPHPWMAPRTIVAGTPTAGLIACAADQLTTSAG